MSTLQRTLLYDVHAQLGARFVEFAGYEMPVQYPLGLMQEHLWTRSHAGLFDVSHMGQLRIRGDDLHASLERALPIDFADWPVGLQRYSLLLNERGGIDDDLMVLNQGDEVAIIVNASRRDHDVARLRALCPSLSIEWRDAALIALQGPSAEGVLLSVLGDRVTQLEFMHGARFTFDEAPLIVTRSGYTGEDGFEISVPALLAAKFAQRLLAHPETKPIGLGARDTLRLEAGLHLYGQDMNPETTPPMARLDWAIARSRRTGGTKAGGYAGASRLSEPSPTVRRLEAFVGREAVPIRHGCAITDGNDNVVGEVTSGTVSPTLQRPILLGYLDTQVVIEEPLFATVRAQRRPIQRSTLPFVPKRYKRSKAQ